MFEIDSPAFIGAIILVTTMTMIIIGMSAMQYVTSSQRLRKARDLAEAAIEQTTAFMTIVFDKRDRVIDLRMQDAKAEAYFYAAFRGKKKETLGFLPDSLLESNGAVLNSGEQERTTVPLKMPDDSVLYLRWEMQNHTNPSGATEYRLVRGYNRTEELLQTQNMLKKLSATASEREERERKRIADNLHDHLGEVILTSKRLLADLKKKSPSSEFQQGLEELESAIKEFSRGTHSVIYDLIPPALYNVGLAAAIEADANKLAKQERLEIHLDDHLGDFHLNHDLAFFLYKAALELLRNAFKHGGADEMLVTLQHTDGTVAVTVEDNGSGFDAAADLIAPNLDSGFGLFSIKNRAEYYRGDLQIDNTSTLGGGKVTVWIKLNETEGAWEK